MRIRTAVGYSLDEVNGEIERAIEETYPIKQGKPFITLHNVTDHVLEKKEEYPILTKQHERFMKLLVHQYCTIKNWAKYTKSRGCSKSPVFVRPIN